MIVLRGRSMLEITPKQMGILREDYIIHFSSWYFTVLYYTPPFLIIFEASSISG
jgi:hypothetical protein